MSSPAADKAFRLRSLTVSVYLPSFLFAVGQGAVITILPLFARELGASVALAGALVAIRSMGMLVFDDDTTEDAYLMEFHYDAESATQPPQEWIHKAA